MPDSYPLDWPGHWARTPDEDRVESRFKQHSPGVIQNDLLTELERFRAKNLTISCDMLTRHDGRFRAGAAEPPDPGVAVYFHHRGRPMVIACDYYLYVWENLKAITKTIEAMRTIERHGASQLLERAVAGFSALPPGDHEAPAQPSKPWWEILGIPENWVEDIRAAAGDVDHPMRAPLLKMAETTYKIKVQDAHPDRGGSIAEVQDLNLAVGQARHVLGKKEKDDV